MKSLRGTFRGGIFALLCFWCLAMRGKGADPACDTQDIQDTEEAQAFFYFFLSTMEQIFSLLLHTLILYRPRPASLFEFAYSLRDKIIVSMI